VEGDAIVVASAAQSLALAGQIRDQAAARANEVEQELVKVRTRLAEAEAEIVLLRREVQKLKGAPVEGGAL
jgi:predicted  nucleic acid-binding Zn-ribbon protein